MKVTIAQFAHADAPLGYGVITGYLKRALERAGVEIQPRDSFQWDAVLAISLPTAWVVGKNVRRDLIWHTMFESENIPADWIDILNRVGGVWFPSHYCRDAFNAAGLKVPSFVAGYGIDDRYFFPTKREVKDKPFKFVIWTHDLGGRKNALLAARAFLEADLPRDEAILEIKLNGTADGSPVIKDQYNQPFPHIKAIAENWPITKLGDWLREADCLISLSSGEGFGLTPLEAMACGTPVISVRSTGHSEYMTPHNAMCVPIIGKKLDEGYTMAHKTDVYMDVPDIDVAIEYIRWAFYNRKATYAIGEEGAKEATKWTWERTGILGRTGLGEIVKC